MNLAVCAVLVIIFWDFLMFDQVFLSPQVKRSSIISNKHGIFDFPHDFPYDLRLKTYDLTTWNILKLGNIRKISKLKLESLPSP